MAMTGYDDPLPWMAAMLLMLAVGLAAALLVATRAARTGSDTSLPRATRRRR